MKKSKQKQNKNKKIIVPILYGRKLFRNKQNKLIT